MHELLIWLELLVVLAAIFVGSRVGGVGLGLIAAIGLAVLVFVFGLPPSSPPGTVIAIVVAVVCAAATLQSAGGMALLVSLADPTGDLLSPRRINITADLLANEVLTERASHELTEDLPITRDELLSARDRLSDELDQSLAVVE